MSCLRRLCKYAMKGNVKMETIKGYKVFNPDWTCRGFQYKVGEIFIHNDNIKMCEEGFHFCRKAADCFNYYDFDSKNKVAEVEAVGLVETHGNKSVTDKIKIVREIEWQELLTIVNEGNDCTGLCNTGNSNAGNSNTGNRNTGNRNTGDWNAGDYNTGYYNTGDWNTGDYNTGDRNTGYYNAGDWNTGNWNTGNWNSINYSTGFFNSCEQQPIYMFNRPTNKFRDEIIKMEGMRILCSRFTNSKWVCSEDMTDEEKAAHPEHETTGGYLKTVDFKTACRLMWSKLSDDEKSAVMQLPNFDTDVFEEITGINVKE